MPRQCSLSQPAQLIITRKHKCIIISQSSTQYNVMGLSTKFRARRNEFDSKCSRERSGMFDVAGFPLKHATFVTSILWLLGTKDSASAYTFSQSLTKPNTHSLPGLVISHHSSSNSEREVESCDVQDRKVICCKSLPPLIGAQGIPGKFGDLS